MAIEPGPLLASGRDSDIFEFGLDKVLRRARDGRSIAHEAALMAHVRSHGYPVPEVHEVRAGGTELVMDRIDGPHLLDAIASRPWRLPRLAGVLAGLHRQLHAIAPPEGLRELGDGGTALVHLDLHPLTVRMSARGPVVIDWANAAVAHPAVDVADTWAVLAAAQVPGTGLKTRVLGRARALFVRAFLSHFDRDEVRAHLALAVERRSADRNMSPAELAAMRRLLS